MYTDIFPTIETKCTSGDQTAAPQPSQTSSQDVTPQSTTPEVIG